MRRVLTALRRLDDEWLGDILACACLFGWVFTVLFFGVALGGGQ